MLIVFQNVFPTLIPFLWICANEIVLRELSLTFGDKFHIHFPLDCVHQIRKITAFISQWLSP